jgi:hypothetical protein
VERCMEDRRKENESFGPDITEQWLNLLSQALLDTNVSF